MKLNELVSVVHSLFMKLLSVQEGVYRRSTEHEG